MSLIISTGSNLGNRRKNLHSALLQLCTYLRLKSLSKLYYSQAVDYSNQPNFFNQMLEFHLPPTSAHDTMNLLLNIEKKLGRKRTIRKGPRKIDIDLIFFGLTVINDNCITLPHPRWHERSFITLPLKEIPFYNLKLKKIFPIRENPNNWAIPLLK